MKISSSGLAYCTNVHPGSSLEQVQQNLNQFAVPIRRSFDPGGPMAIGLWLSNEAAAELLESKRSGVFAEWLRERELVPRTFNAFPFSNFHQPVVKHQVYSPTWAEPSRLDYTLNVARIQSRLLPTGDRGTVSTLPLGWASSESHSEFGETEFLHRCAENLRQCARTLHDIEEQYGVRVVVCIEPEPGCVIDSSDKLVRFYEQWLLGESQESDALIYSYIGVCHDVCHSAVMFESQQTAIECYVRAGIQIGKIQISSAIAADFDELPGKERNATLNLLSQFAEDRYLHQTVIRSGPESTFYENLPEAIEAGRSNVSGQWRVHFHVPVFARTLAMLSTTQPEIAQCLRALKACGSQEFQPHFEVETYAWCVLPPPWGTKSMGEGIVRELVWTRELLDSL